MGNKTTYILQVILAITGLTALFTLHIIVGFLILFFSYLVWKNKITYDKNDWNELYNSQNRAGRRKMKRELSKMVVGKKKFR